MTGPRRRAEETGTPFRWEGVEVQHVTSGDGETGVRDLCRQILFDDSSMDYQVRFLDIGGHTTLERHKHAHSVVILSGRGQGLIGDVVVDLSAHDLVEVGPWEWHQFRAADGDHLGFLSIVNCNRDRPQLATPADLERLTRFPEIASFLGIPHPESR